MRGELVALDLETTGLDPTTDSIIEVGAVRIINGEIVDEFSTLVMPEIPIPPIVTYLTGIQQQDVLGAPTIDTILPSISKFVGDAPLIAHNISLEMGFLQQRHRILLSTLGIDTYDLASVLIPNAPRYNLNSLTAQVGIELQNAHRALDDARATALLYWALWQKAMSLPASTLKEISSAARDLNWTTGAVFLAALQETGSASSDTVQDPEPSSYDELPTQLYNAETITPIDIEPIDHIFGEESSFTKLVPNFESRTQQQQMARAIIDAFNDAHHLMVEAGTGTGKSLAYLVPAAMWAVSNQQRVVISTNTINLQDQLLHHDIPLVRDALGIEFTATLMKGRANYLCPHRFETIRRRRPTSVVELRTLAKILVWMLESKTGDRSEINLLGAENNVWQHLSAEDASCSASQCQTLMCPFYKARRMAESAHLVIVNHALLVSDANSDSHVLPEHSYVVVDEAHHLEDAVTSGASFHLDRTSLQRRLADLGNANRGLLGETLLSLRKNVPDQEVRKLLRFIEAIAEATTLMEHHIIAVFGQLQRVLEDIRSSKSNDFVTSARITPQHRQRTAYAELQATLIPLNEFFDAIAGALKRLARGMSRLTDYTVPQLPELISNIVDAADYLNEIKLRLQGFVMHEDSNAIEWISMAQGAESPVIHSAPLHIGPLVEKHLWNAKASVILTSGTLKTQDSFSFIKDRLHADNVDTLELGSPFDYRSSTLIYIPTDIPEPADRQGYQRAVERGIVELAAMLEGRILVLFTSYTQLRQTAQAITPRLMLGNITVYDQSDGSSRHSLLEGFKSTSKAVLLGTRSFWEGVDIPGNALSALVIVRLPFAVPTDPVFASRSETYTDSFNQYALPEAILRFRQGFGRLIRTPTDRGVVTVFDSRIVKKSYGTSFLEGLPDCTISHGQLENLPRAARDWLKPDTPHED